MIFWTASRGLLKMEGLSSSMSSWLKGASLLRMVGLIFVSRLSSRLSLSICILSWIRSFLIKRGSIKLSKRLPHSQNTLLINNLNNSNSNNNNNKIRIMNKSRIKNMNKIRIKSRIKSMIKSRIRNKIRNKSRNKSRI